MMKQYLLLFFATLFVGTATAQTYAPDFLFNIGVYGGFAPTTLPYQVAYSGDRKTFPKQYGIIGHYNIIDKLQVGIDINTNTEWGATSTTTVNATDGSTLGVTDIHYTYAQRVWSTTARLNGVVPMYDNLRNNRSNFYYGIAAGGIFTVNDAEMTYSQFDEKRGEQYRYLSEYHYEPAAGYTLGFQVGMEWYTKGALGFNAEFAPRFSHLNTVDNRIGSGNGPYDIFSFPFSVGVRFRFGSGGGYRF
jgi:hypothetical protein